jgi:hypothetical protein
MFGPTDSLKDETALLKGEKSEVTLSEAELNAVKAKIDAMRLLLQRHVVAKYKVEVQFGKARSSTTPFPGVISLWLSGTKFNGGGDEKIYECPRDTCGALIMPDQITQSQVIENGVPDFKSVSICGKCGTAWESSKTSGERFYKLTTQNWAIAILKMFRKVHMNADIYLKYHPTDIRYKAAMELVRNRGGEEIAKARSSRGVHIYPLKNIIMDVKHGSELLKRIGVFISS